MTTAALLLNADYRPLRVIPWVRALMLVLDGKADLVERYAGRLLRSPSTALPWPAVVRLRRYVRTQGGVRFSRQNVLARDGYRCAYCAAAPVTRRGQPDLERLTLDHVVPRVQARDNRVILPWSGKVVPTTCWENVVTACHACNHAKGSSRAQGAGADLSWCVELVGRPAALRLTRYPRRPTPLDLLRMSLCRAEIPSEWKDYLPRGSEWRGYWEEELDPG